MVTFQKLLIQHRKKLHLNKAEMAKKIGWTPMYYARYENGKMLPSSRNIALFARMFRMSKKELQDIINQDKETNRLIREQEK
jgi:transcriptional regulator with XRE-family HTH domain